MIIGTESKVNCHSFDEYVLFFDECLLFIKFSPILPIVQMMWAIRNSSFLIRSSSLSDEGLDYSQAFEPFEQVEVSH